MSRERDEAPTIISQIKGVPYRGDNACFVVAELMSGDPLIIEREPHNEADANAVKVVAPMDPDGLLHIGYIARDQAAVLSLWMDRGWMYQAWCSAPAKRKSNSAGTWVKIDTCEATCVPLKPVSIKQTKKVHEHV